MLEPKREYRLAQLRGPSRCRTTRATFQQELHHLLADRRTALDDTSGTHVPPRGAGNGAQVDAGMPMEAHVLGGQRGVFDERRNPCRGDDVATKSVGRADFVQRLAMPIGDACGDAARSVEQTVRQRTHPHAGQSGQHDEARSKPDASPREVHSMTIVTGAVRPLISGAYIASASAGAAVNVPVVVARVTYENS